MGVAPLGAPAIRRPPVEPDCGGDQLNSGDTVELLVGGMTCGACAARVQRSLSRLDGVQASVNAVTALAWVRLSQPVLVEELVAAVAAAGYTATVRRPDRTGETTQTSTTEREVRGLLRRLVVALLMCVPLGDLSIGVVISPWLRFPGWQWVLLILTTPVVAWCAWPMHVAAWRAARHRAATMDSLVSIGVLASCGWSIYTIFFAQRGITRHTPAGWSLLWQPSGSVYLEVATGVTTFVLAGRLAEARARRRAGSALQELAAVTSKPACVIEADGQQRWVPAADLRIGDRFAVRAGEPIAADGEVVEGQAAVDTSTMTGEPVPASVVHGDQVLGGTRVVDGRLVVRAACVGGATQLAQLVRLAEQAQHNKASVQRLADRVSGIFVPVVLALAVLTLAAWLATGAPADRAVGAGLAVLIIACPCALGLATPSALLTAAGRAAQLGIFVKSQQALETARMIDTVVLDKTGTITTGQLSVAQVEPVPGVSTAELVALTGAVEDGSTHPIAHALTGHARQLAGAQLPAVGGFVNLPGRGARGTVDARQVLIGSVRLFDEQQIVVPAAVQQRCAHWQQLGCTIVLVAIDGITAGLIALTDTVRPSAPGAVAALKALGLQTVLLTGDNEATAETVGNYTQVDQVIAEVLPVDKAAVIARLQAMGRTVAMVGDGINDAPALAQADLGLVVVSGSDIAVEVADILLVREDLGTVPTAIGLARATLRTIRGNLAWAFGYNIAAIPVAAAGLLNPIIAAGAMAASSLLVVGNSLRLKHFAAQPGVLVADRVGRAGSGPWSSRRG